MREGERERVRERKREKCENKGKERGRIIEEIYPKKRLIFSSAYLDQLKGLLLDCGAVLHSNCRVQLVVRKFQDCYRLWLRPTHHHLNR